MAKIYTIRGQRLQAPRPETGDTLSMSSSTLSSKERILAAMRRQIPDRVPVQLGIFSIAPRLTGAPFWDTYLPRKWDLDALMLRMVREFGFDGYLYTHLPDRIPGDQRTWEKEIVRQDDSFIVERTTVKTPHGDLWQERADPKFDQPTTTRGFVKNESDFRVWLEAFFAEEYEWDLAPLMRNKEAMGNDGAVAATLTLPGLHHLIEVFDGKLEPATYFLEDHPALIEEYRLRHEHQILSKLERLLEARPDYIEFGASGLLTLSSPPILRQLSLPTLVKATRMCREAGIPSEPHCCGREREVVQICAEETELDSINPLQPSPMGDCDLAEVKRAFGSRLCLKGNVGVTFPMLMGGPADVEADVMRCLDAGKAGGGFILFTEEGLGRDTPFENIRKFIEVGHALGTY